jgi:beta-N-acetylhexosaminidase
MPSADDALAFFAKLAAGKEDQLRAQAQLEAESRMSEIMGRKPVAAPEPAADDRSGVGLAAVAAIGAAAGLAAVTKQEPDQPPGQEIAAESVEESTDWLSDLSASAVSEPVSVDELPDWLKQMRPPEETLEPAAELPEWLHAMRPAETDDTAGLVALLEEEDATEELETAVSAAEIPAWLRSMQPSAEGESRRLALLPQSEPLPWDELMHHAPYLRALDRLP